MYEKRAATWTPISWLEAGLKNKTGDISPEHWRAAGKTRGADTLHYQEVP